jgi:hypothetical protein
MHYYYILNNNTIITHDGEVQTGIIHMSVETFLSKVKVNYEQTYWLPDPFIKRYKRKNFQNHLYCQHQWRELINEKEKK